MRKVIVDTNIIFSCLLNSQGTIGDLIFNSETVFDFYSNEYMLYEIRKHWERLKKISKLTDFELQTSYDKLLIHLTFINEQLIPENIWRASETFVADIDIDDTDFVALTKYLKGILWTGDKPLYNGLKAKRSRSAYNTADLIKLRNRLLAE
ncbi:MAG TPA: PIN domain-containing protein [Parafilimonas sp.]|nr:PIN domain-containing protein [Parafilimonas sp.]